MLKDELKKILSRYYKKSMINAIIRGAKPIHMDYARELHNKGILELNSWANITKYLEEEEKKAKQKKEQQKTSIK